MRATAVLFGMILGVGICALAADPPPYPRSKIITSLTWDPAVHRMGTTERVGDNWPITWGDDDILYTSFDDGGGFSNRTPKLTLGFSKIIGNPPSHRAEDILSDADTPAGGGKQGIKSSGLLMVDRVLYLFVRNYKVDGDYRHSRLAWSADYEKTWRWANWHFAETFGCPDFVQFGKNYAGARDAYVYVVSQANNDAYLFSPDIVMARVPKKKVADRAAYEFFAGLNASGAPRWSRQIEDRKPIFTDPRGTQRISMTYNAGVKRYIMTASHLVRAGQDDEKSARKENRDPWGPSLGVFDAPEPWGPWTTVYYDDHWSGTDQTYHHKFPTKWMSADGRTMWLVFSGINAAVYGFCVRRATIETASRAGKAR